MRILFGKNIVRTEIDMMLRVLITWLSLHLLSRLRICESWYAQFAYAHLKCFFARHNSKYSNHIQWLQICASGSADTERWNNGVALTLIKRYYDVELTLILTVYM